MICNTYKTLADLALVEPALAAAEGDVVHLLVAAVEARVAVRAARRRRRREWQRQRRQSAWNLEIVLEIYFSLRVII